MKKFLIPVFLLSLVFLSACTKDQVQGVLNSVSNNTGLSDSTIVAGLKAALNVGTDSSATESHKTDGFFKNPFIKIPFPADAQAILDVVSKIPFGQSYVDNVVLSLNRAAEDAAIKAKPIFISAITGITITDGKNILFGDSLAATNYLSLKTYTDLRTAFLPEIKNSLDKVSATKYWSDLVSVYNLVPGVSQINTNLPDYATCKALDGLFYLVGNEEKKIRKDPAARVSDILRTVFGQLDKH
jgi:hypothetical protein